MDVLNLGGSEEELPKSGKSSRKIKAALGFGGLAAISGIGSTLAANVTLNSGSAIEFGQGVSETLACDSDGFTLTPVTRYDTNLGIFRIDYVDVTGINLTPQGQNWQDANSYDNAGFADQAAAVSAHPGQYWDTGTNQWTNTCDKVVLDFKAFTDNANFARYTVNGYVSQDSNGYGSAVSDTQTPLIWSQNFYGNKDNFSTHSWDATNYDFAVVVDAANSRYNYGSDNNTTGDTGYNTNYPWYRLSNTYGLSPQITYGGSNSTIRLQTGDNNYDMYAAPVAKFTVETSNYFPEGYSDSYGNGDYSLGKIGYDGYSGWNY